MNQYYVFSIVLVHSDGQVEIDIDDNSWVSVNYSDIDEEVEIITEDEYTEMLKDRFHPFRVECEFQHKYIFLVLN